MTRTLVFIDSRVADDERLIAALSSAPRLAARNCTWKH